MTRPAVDSRIEWLDVLRGASAFAIVLFHVRVAMWVGLRELAAGEGQYSAIDRALAWITAPFPLFGSAVMLFFVVSGFAIHYPYAAQAPLRLRPYAVRRFFRIYPPYAVAVILTIALEYIVRSLGAGVQTPTDKTLGTLAMVQNYGSPYGQMAGNPSLWSLPVEVELYFVYPLLVWIWRRAGTPRMVAFVAAVSAAAATPLIWGALWPLGNFAKYWIIWVSGAVLAEWVRTNAVPRWRRIYSYAMLGCAALVIIMRLRGVNAGFEHFAWGGIYFLLVLWALNRPDVLHRLPDVARRALRFLGDISYSLYLIHFPLLLACGALWMWMFGAKPANVFIPLAVSLVPIPIAYVLWRVVERPSQAAGRALSQPSASTTAGTRRIAQGEA